MSSGKQERLEKQLRSYLPEGFEPMVATLLLKYPVRFAIKAPRNTKLGDYRPPIGDEKHHRISVNGNLNRYSFLITTLHEFAHLEAFLNYGHRIKPHGEEWKQTYRTLLWPAITSGKLPKVIENALMKSLSNTKASSCSDTQLSRVLRQFDPQQDDSLTLEELPKNATFALQGRHFRKGDLRRTRFLCEELSSRRNFLIHALATVQHIE
jgi:SprT protein